MSPRVLLFVQHLWGIGHVARSFAVAAACAGRGASVTVVLGGPESGLPVPDGVKVVQLPPITAGDAAYRTLVTDSGHPVGDSLWRARRVRLLETLTAVQPTHLLTEHFPFGRRKQRPEYEALLEAARQLEPRPLILCSVRDILEDPINPAKRAGQIALIARFYDQVLVHGDPNLIPLEASLPHARIIRDRITYTGYVHRSMPTPQPTAERDGVVVSAGCGRDAAPLITAALDAHTRWPHLPWTVITGPGACDMDLPDRPGLTVMRHDPNLPRRLARARVAVSRAGYNTVAESLAAHVPLILVPYTGADQKEQTLRAEILKRRGLADVVDPSTEGGAASLGQRRGLGPRLAEAVGRQLAKPVARELDPEGFPCLDGAARMADWIFAHGP